MSAWRYLALAIALIGVSQPVLTLTAFAETNPCPVNGLTNVQWLFDAPNGTCTYPKIIAGRGDTGQQTDIVMSVADAKAYVQSLGDPRTLFLDPAKALNNRSLTNMSDEAL